jgi:hypothetical protein
MRKNSPKQTAASRKNGSEGKGPKSPAGKKAVRLNALKDGLFSTQVVIETAGERPEDFERLKKQLWECFKPESPLEEMLVTDLIESRWRLQRVRRAESLVLKTRLETSWVRNELRRSEELESLKGRFFNLWGKYVLLSSSQVQQDALEMTPELEEVRRQLASTSEGLEFLIKQMKKLEEAACSRGYLSSESALLMLACCGFGNDFARIAVQLNSMNMKIASTEKSDTSKDDSSKDEALRLIRELQSKMKQNRTTSKATARGPRRDENTEPQSADQSRTERDIEAELRDASDLNAWVLAGAIYNATSALRLRKRLLSPTEKWEEQTRSAMAIVPADASDRFSRAETALERRMYRALGMLLAIREGVSRSPQSPQLPGAGSPPPSSSN